MDNHREFGCFTIIMVFIFVMLITTSIDKLTTQVKRVSDQAEQCARKSPPWQTADCYEGNRK